MARRRIGTYLYSGSERVAKVRAPQITIPEEGKNRIAFTPMGFSVSCSASVRTLTNPTAPLRFASVPAGAFQTPRRASIRAYVPVTYPDAGTGMGVTEEPVGSVAFNHGK